MAASSPPLTPTPTCPSGMKVSGRKGKMEEQQSLLTRHWIVSPTAMGRNPPPFLTRAVKGAPHSHGAMMERALPEGC